MLILFAIFTSKGSSNSDFFQAGKHSPWYLVAFGMIGASLSGVTYISIPGYVGQAGWSYFMMVIGYWFGYWVIRKYLLPLYYEQGLVSIYGSFCFPEALVPPSGCF
jgi:Na+/proline symporter